MQLKVRHDHHILSHHLRISISILRLLGERQRGREGRKGEREREGWREEGEGWREGRREGEEKRERDGGRMVREMGKEGEKEGRREERLVLNAQISNLEYL